MADKNIPGSVKIVSVLYFIGAGLAILFGLIFLIASPYAAEIFKDLPLAASASGALLIFFGLFMLIIGVVSVFIGRGLRQGKFWARILALIFAWLGAIEQVFLIKQSPFGSIVVLLLDAYIIYQLGFNKETKKFFH